MVELRCSRRPTVRSPATKSNAHLLVSTVVTDTIASNGTIPMVDIAQGERIDVMRMLGQRLPRGLPPFLGNHRKEYVSNSK
jgi:hypothetical protein